MTMVEISPGVWVGNKDEDSWLREVSEEFLAEMKKNGADADLIYAIRKDNAWKRAAKSVIADLQGE